MVGAFGGRDLVTQRVVAVLRLTSSWSRPLGLSEISNGAGPPGFQKPKSPIDTSEEEGRGLVTAVEYDDGVCPHRPEIELTLDE